MRQLGILLLLVLLCDEATSVAQVTRRDLDDLERHRKADKYVPVIQSIENDSLAWEVSVAVETWDFLEGDDPDLDEREPLPSLIGQEQIKDALLPHFWESPDSLLATMVADYIVKHRKGLSVVLGRYKAYEEELRAVFRSSDLPEDLTVLAAVESAMNPLALSKAGARGMWQFMPGTARSYGLRCDEIVDERLDYLSSAYAAAAYLEKAFARYGDWRLAISSYNCGTGAVEKAIRRARSKDYWRIYPFLPAETRGYFPAFAATLYAFLYKNELGIEERRFTRDRGALFKVECNTTLKEIAGATGIGLGDLRQMNPQFISGIIPGRSRAYYIRIPHSFASEFKLYLSNKTES